jgi:hypothetical protein
MTHDCCLHSPLPPFFFACSALTLASASNCFLAAFAIDHFAKLSAVTGVPTCCREEEMGGEEVSEEEKRGDVGRGDMRRCREAVMSDGYRG